MDRSLKNLVYGACRWTGWTSWREQATRFHVPILIYHGVTRDPLRGVANCDGTHVHAGALKNHLSWIKRRRRVIALSDYADYLERGAPPPPNAAVLTFDDGYAGHSTQVLPLLTELGLHATFFVPTAPVEEGLPLWEDRLAAAFAASTLEHYESPLDGSLWSLDGPRARGRAYLAAKALLKSRAPQTHQAALAAALERLAPGRSVDVPPELRPLTPEQLSALARSPYAAVGSHTLTHVVLTGLAGERARGEIAGSRRRLAQLSGVEPDTFSYPSGLWSEALARAVEKAGYRCAVAGGLTLNAPGKTDRWALARLALAEGDSAAAAAATLCGLRASALGWLGRAR